MRFLNKDHQWKIGQLIVGALICFIACLAAFGAAGFFWLQHDLEEKIVQPLLERELNRVLEGFRSEYLAGGSAVSGAVPSGGPSVPAGSGVSPSAGLPLSLRWRFSSALRFLASSRWRFS